MQFFARSPVQLVRRLVARLRALRTQRQSAPSFIVPFYPSTTQDFTAPIHRDVTSNGVRVYSLCGDCGSRLQASATLCEDCAQKRSRPARPY